MVNSFCLPGLLLLTIVIVMMTPSFGAEQEQQPANLVIDLVDGSRISGTTTARALSFRTAYAGMDLEIELIQRIDFANGEKNVRVLLNNGDILQGAFEFNALKVETLLGMQSIPLALISTISIRRQNTQRGLVLHYSFDDIGSNLIPDKSGQGNHGIVHGAVANTSGESPLREFDGRRVFIECSDSPSLKMPGSMSILTWMKPNAWGNGKGSCVVSKKESDYGNGYVLYNDGYLPDKLNLRIKGTAGPADMIHSRSTVNTKALQHWAVTYDADVQEVRFYKDSVLDTIYVSVSVGDMSNELPLHVGHAQTWGGFFEGSMGNVMMYDRALSPEEVMRIYDSQSSLKH